MRGKRLFLADCHKQFLSKSGLCLLQGSRMKGNPGKLPVATPAQQEEREQKGLQVGWQRISGDGKLSSDDTEIEKMERK